MFREAWYVTFSDSFENISSTLGISAKRVYKENGTEVTDLYSVDNNDILFVSQV